MWPRRVARDVVEDWRRWVNSGQSYEVPGLSSFRVVEFCGDVAGQYCGKLLADAGADVIKVEPDGGEPLRRYAPPGVDLPAGETGALFQYLNTSKRSVGEGELTDLLGSADILLEDREIGWLEHRDYLERFVHLVVVSITAFGRGGPESARRGPELIVQAEAGAIACRGRSDMDPIHAGGRIGAYTTGSHAAPPAIAAAMQARRTGIGRHIDVSAAEVMNIACTTFTDLATSLGGRPNEYDKVARNVETPSIEPALDGWVGFNTNTGEQFQRFCLLIERPDLLDSPWMGASYRIGNLDAFNEIVHAWTRRHTVEEILAKAAELRIPSAAVGAAAELMQHEQLIDRGVFVDNPSGGFKQPRQPYLLDGAVLRPLESVPTPHEHAGAIEVRPRPEPDGSPAGALPLDGLRVIDFTSWWAGPASTSVLANLGATVIHVESTEHPDGMRLTGAMFQQADWWEWGHLFLAVNNNKLDITLDLSEPRGLDLAKRLISGADVVVENFSPRVMDRFGLDHAGVRVLNPHAVYARMPAFGLSGPWRDRVGFAQTMEQMTGMAWVTGFPQDQPRIMRGPCDPIAGMHGAVAMLAALATREETGVGVAIEATMVEAALNAAPEIVIDASAYGVRHERAGNRSPYAAPQGVYRCAGGPDEWIAIAVETDADWVLLCAVIGEESLATKYSTEEDRRAAHDEIDTALEAWALTTTAVSAAELLHGEGLAAARLFDPRDASLHPQFVARGFFESVDHPVVGTQVMPSSPYRMSGVGRWLRTPAPTLGQHNEEILDQLGLSAEEIEELRIDGQIGTRPFGR